MNTRHLLDPTFWPFRWAPFLHADGDGATGGGSAASSGTTGDTGATNGGATPPATSNPPVPQPNWNEFLSGLDRLNDTLGGKLDTLVSDVRVLPDRMTPAPAETPPDFESMSRPELVAHIVGTLQKSVADQIKEALAPLVQQVTSTQQSVAASTVGATIQRMQSEHKDFGDWKPEMVALAKVHPTLDIPDLYRLARANDPAKSSSLDTKYNPPSPPPVRFGGLLPTARGNGAAPPMNKEDASREAYREVQSRHAHVLRALDDI